VTAHVSAKACPGLDPGPRYCADEAQTTTSGLLAGLGITPQEAERSVRNVAWLRFVPQ
jgi:hypothetical protein